MTVVLLLLALLLAAFSALRLYTVLAVHERQVIACWERLDTLLAQRNGHLRTLQADPPDSNDHAAAANPLGPTLERHERARLRGTMPELVAAERDIRDLLDRIPRDRAGAEEAVRRVTVLQQALDDVATRYDEAIDRYDQARGRLLARQLAAVLRFPVYSPLSPRRRPEPPQ